MAPITLLIKPRSGSSPISLELDEHVMHDPGRACAPLSGAAPDPPCCCAQADVADLKKAFHTLKRKYYPSRQRFSLPAKPGEKSGVVLESGRTLADYGLRSKAELEFKDLGPQVQQLAKPPRCQRCVHL